MRTKGWCSRCRAYVDYALFPPQSLGKKMSKKQMGFRRQRWEEWLITLSCGHQVIDRRGRTYLAP